MDIDAVTIAQRVSINLLAHIPENAPTTRQLHCQYCLLHSTPNMHQLASCVIYAWPLPAQLWH